MNAGSAMKQGKDIIIIRIVSDNIQANLYSNSSSLDFSFGEK